VRAAVASSTDPGPSADFSARAIAGRCLAGNFVGPRALDAITGVVVLLLVRELLGLLAVRKSCRRRASLMDSFSELSGLPVADAAERGEARGDMFSELDRSRRGAVLGVDVRDGVAAADVAS
jgi:hypothetical protein